MEDVSACHALHPQQTAERDSAHSSRISIKQQHLRIQFRRQLNKQSLSCCTISLSTASLAYFPDAEPNKA